MTSSGYGFRWEGFLLGLLSPPTASAVETAATKNEHEEDDDQNHSLGDGNSSLLCARLTERGVPFLIYSGHTTVEGPCAGALHINKPAKPGELVAAMESLILN